MERHTHPELEEVVTEAAIRMPPDKVRYRRDRRVCTDPDVIAAAERESGTRIAAAAPAATGLDPRETETGAEEQTTGRLRIVVAGQRQVPRRDRGAALAFRPGDALRTQEQVGTHRP